MTYSGFTADEIDKLCRAADAKNKRDKEETFDIDEALKSKVPPTVKPSEVWKLGDHRLMCGDSTSSSDMARLMGDRTAQLIFTDPPWNVAYGTADHPTYKKRAILNDNMPTEQFGSFLLSAFQRMAEVTDPGGMTYVVMSAQEWGNAMTTLAEAGFHWSSTIIWEKDSLVLSRKDYHTQYEPIWYGWKDGEKRLCPLKDRKQSDIWEIPRPRASPNHPTTKPVPLVVRIIDNSSHPNDTVLDPFCGSGTTVIACEKTGRSARVMELDPKYADVIRLRWEAFTGQKAKLEP